MSNPSKNKGSSAERELAALLDAAFGDGSGSIQRNLEQSRGESTADIVFEYGSRTFLVEVKRRESLSRGMWFKQAEGHARKKGHGVPLVAYRKNRQGWRVFFRSRNGMMDLSLNGWTALTKACV